MTFDFYGFYEEISRRRPAIRMDAGDPDIPPPPEVVEVLRREADRLSYTPPTGLPELLEAIAELHGVDAGEVAVVPGAKAAVAAVIARSRRIGLVKPYWPGYAAAAGFLGVEVTAIAVGPGSGWTPSPEAIGELAGRADAVFVNYPNNPTGAVIGRRLAAEFIAEARSRGAYLVSDEAYRDIVFAGDRFSLAELDSEGVLSVYSFSKTFSLPGLRIGYVVGDKGLVRMVRDFVAATYTCVPAPAQRAAVKALELLESRAREVSRVYMRRLRIAEEALGGAFEYVRPRGAFYLFPRIRGGVDGVEAAYRLLERGVAVFPGAAFGGSEYSSYIRVSLTQPEERLAEGLRILGETLWGLSE